ncbi:hypothetical protein WH47_02284 [Habropoda laboriosa]|uniref:Uncharacterized protein n=1 Tax=Habropoda laboriosa TaxID=597456 RepID=A0A0L7QYQ5_9HYME|nr:hypothetical protein WH47_02284 [Habropoda laboriosa]
MPQILESPKDQIQNGLEPQLRRWATLPIRVLLTQPESLCRRDHEDTGRYFVTLASFYSLSKPPTDRTSRRMSETPDHACLNPNLAVRIFAVGLLQFLDVCLNPNLAPDKTSSTASRDGCGAVTPIFLRNAAQCILTSVIERESVDMHGYGRWIEPLRAVWSYYALSTSRLWPGRRQPLGSRECISSYAFCRGDYENTSDTRATGWSRRQMKTIYTTTLTTLELLCLVAKFDCLVFGLSSTKSLASIILFTLEEYPTFSRERSVLQQVIGWDLSPAAVVAAMLSGERSWNAVASCEEVMSQKEAAERAYPVAGFMAASQVVAVADKYRFLKTPQVFIALPATQSLGPDTAINPGVSERKIERWPTTFANVDGPLDFNKV